MGWLLQKPKNFGIPALKRLIFWGSFQYRNWKNDVSFRRMCLKIPGPKNDGDKISLSAKLKSSIRTSSTAGGTALCFVDGKKCMVLYYWSCVKDSMNFNNGYHLIWTLGSTKIEQYQQQKQCVWAKHVCHGVDCGHGWDQSSWLWSRFNFISCISHRRPLMPKGCFGKIVSKQW